MPFRDERLAWIFGSSRSGSTWLLRMLGDTGGVVPIDDPHIGHHLGIWRPIPLAWAAAREMPDLTTLAEIKRDKPDYFFSDRYRSAWLPALCELIAARFDAQVSEVAQRKAIPAPITVVKEPGSHAAGLLLEMFPSSSLIFLQRDGRDVVDSWVDAYQRGSWAQEEGAFAVSQHGRLALIRWLSSVWVFRTEVVAATAAAHDPARTVVVRYEELLAEPAAGLQRIAEVIGLDVGAEKLERVAAAHDYERISPRRRGNGKEIRAARPGGWRENLSQRERGAMLEIMGPTLALLGYGRGEDTLEPAEPALAT